MRAPSRVDRVARQQHFHRALPADVSCERHHWRAAEQPDAHARRREGRFAGSYREIARRDELTARRRRDARDFGDNRLRNRRDARHQRHARFENSSIRSYVAIDQLAKIVPGGERRSFAA